MSKKSSPVLDEPPQGLEDVAIAEASLYDERDRLADEYPPVEWRDSELPYLFLACGVATADDLSLINSSGLSELEIKRRASRAKTILQSFRKAGSRSELTTAEREEAETRNRISSEREAEKERHRQEVAQHLRRLAELDREERNIGQRVVEMRNAQKRLNDLLPESVKAQRALLRDQKDSDLADRLRDAEQTLNLLRMVEADALVMPGRVLPEGLFNDDSLLYIGMEALPERLPMWNEPGRPAQGDYNTGWIEPKLTDPNYERIRERWEMRKAELIAMIPAAKQELADAQRAMAEDRAQRHAAMSKLSYVRE